MFASSKIKLILLAALAGASTAHAQEIDATELVERMSAEIASLEAFIVRGDAYADARLDAGQIIEHSSQVTLQLRREPSAIRISNQSTEDTKEIYFNDGAVNVYSTAENFYAQAEIPKGVDSMLEFAVDDIGIESPMLDLIATDVADDLLTDVESISYLGTSLIRDKVYHHVGIRYPETDAQIWIASERRPLPGKLAISSKWEGGAPRFVAFFEWDTDPEFAQDTFTFDPPDGAVQIDFADKITH